MARHDVTLSDLLFFLMMVMMVMMTTMKITMMSYQGTWCGGPDRSPDAR